MKKIRRVSVVIFTLLVCLVFVPAAFAHPLGNFTINQYAGLIVSREQVLLDYVLDMAEIPAFQEIAVLDANGNGLADPAEAAGYPVDQCTALRPDLKLLLNDRPVDFTLTSSSVEFPAGVGGLATLRLTCEFQAPLDPGSSGINIAFSNNAFPDRLGWREMVVMAEGVSLQGDFTSTSLSQRLMDYPQDLLTSPLDQRQVELKITSLAVSGQNGSPATSEESMAPAADRNDAFTRLILLDKITFPTLLFALFISFVWGAMHAMTPGHGKTIVGAYLVGSRGTPRHALYLGLTTTITHTLGVFALGLVTLFAASFVLPEKLYPWMGFLSGLFVVVIGINLFVSRFKSSGLIGPFQKLKIQLGKKTSPAYLTIQSIGEHVHADGTAHTHNYLLQPSPAYHSHVHGRSHHHADSTETEHSHSEHSHLPPGGDGAPVTWRSLLALGISGGIIPCPSALVVLLGAIALNRIGFGLVLVLAFSLGLASALTAIGLVFIYAGRFFERIPVHSKIVRALPVLSALFIALIGLVITLRALQETGIIVPGGV